MIRIAHISDSHFGTEDPPVRDALRDELLRAAPDLVVLTGDVTQRARRGQFRAARAFLDSLAPLPILALPGNHDLPLFDLFTRFTAPYRYFRRYVGDTLAPCWQGGEVAVVGVNSTRVLRHKHGSLPPALVDEVARRLDRLDAAFKLVALHHPLAVVDPHDRRNRVRGADRALEAWVEAGADLFLAGHIHLPYCVAVGSLKRRALVVQAGTSVSTRRRDGRPNSYNLMQLDGAAERRVRIEERDHDRRGGHFVLHAAHEAVCGDGGWSVLAGAAAAGRAPAGESGPTPAVER